MRRQLIWVACFAVAGCGILDSEPVTYRELEVAPYKRWCDAGVLERLCLQVREPGQTEFQALYEGPDGFDFDWGFEYVIIVEERERDEVLVDQSSIMRGLNRVVSLAPAPAGTTFELNVPSEWVQPLGESRFQVQHAPVEIECDSDCVELANSAEITPRVLLVLMFSGNTVDPLQLLDWHRCTDPSRSSCS